jgi:hypothetical protein
VILVAAAIAVTVRIHRRIRAGTLHRPHACGG